MDTILIVVVGIVLAGLAIRWVSIARDEQHTRMLNAYSRQVGLALVREIAPTLSLRLYRRERAGILGSMTGIVVGAIVLTVLDDSDSSWSGMLLVVAMTIGSTIAVIVTDSRSAFAPVAESPRLARSVSPRLDDYVTPLDRAFSLGFIGLATLGYIAVLGIIAINPERMFDDVSVRTILWPAGSLLALATAASLTTWTSAGALLGRGQPASTFVELAWSDAFRSTTLRGLVSVPGVIAAVSAGVLFLSLSGALSSATPSAFGGVLAGSFTVMGPVLLIALLAWYLTSLRNRSTTHYLRRLWPETAVELDRRRGARSSGVTGPPDGGSRAKTPA